MSLFQEIKQSAEGRELSLRWYRNKIRSLGGEQKPVTEYIREGDGGARPIFGMMNMFRYQPKTAKKLKYYDVYPLVLVFKRHRNGFTGLNFHYLSIPMRVKVLERLDIFGDDASQKIDAKWSEMRTVKAIAPLVRRYDAKHVRSLFLQIPLDDMYVATLLPVQRFYKGEYKFRKPVSDRTVWQDSRRMVYG